MKTPRVTELALVAAALFAATAGACSLFRLGGKPAEPVRPFSHKAHGPDEGLGCSDCHVKAEKGEEAGMPPNLKKCMLCHEAMDEQKPGGRRLTDLVGQAPAWTSVTKLPDEVKFSHKTHLDAKVGCADCHKGIGDSVSITSAVRVDMDSCMACHAEKAKPNDCSTCHAQISKDVPPASHRHSWKEVHGETVKASLDSGTTSRCELCHDSRTCIGCHQDEAPRNHTNFWRIQGHGVQAGVDRSNCATCHKTDFCDRCHKETAPRTHTSSWGGSQSRHCLTCHEPAADQGCTLCHEGTPSHLSATPKPGWHVAGMNCRNCHGPGLSAPFQHVDNGDNCNNCHR